MWSSSLNPIPVYCSKIDQNIGIPGENPYIVYIGISSMKYSDTVNTYNAIFSFLI